MEYKEKLDAIRANIESALVGRREVLDLVLAAILSRGHILIEDVPGIGKTTLVRALAASVGCTFQRIQFTPDLMPSDVVGFSMPDLAGGMKYRAGAIMHQIILADEINRTSPKTQSALLESMQEEQVTVDGVTYPLPSPFIVLATQNPVEHVGTFPLPEAQLDRFLIRISLGYPGLREEMEILNRHETAGSLVADLKPVVTAENLIDMQHASDRITCSAAIKEYISMIIGQTRVSPDMLLGASPRAAISLMRAAKAAAFLAGREFVLPDDVQAMTIPVLAHRLVLRPEARLREQTPERVLKNILISIRTPDAV